MLRSFCLPPDICQLPSDSGIGDAFQSRFFYNTVSKACESFLYKSSRGNANNFWDKDTCNQFCAPRGKADKVSKKYFKHKKSPNTN
uniref:BPTI/Kunitz inhibitor domain-containing protein n=1 Tax=Laticauda laticaudata TaxID=8630 RepID=A0A8C5RJ56_LATLA